MNLQQLRNKGKNAQEIVRNENVSITRECVSGSSCTKMKLCLKNSSSNCAIFITFLLHYNHSSLKTIASSNGTKTNCWPRVKSPSCPLLSLSNKDLPTLQMLTWKNQIIFTQGSGRQKTYLETKVGVGFTLRC